MHPFRKHIPTHKHMYAHIRSLTRSRTHASSLGNIPPQLVAQFLLFLICFSHTRHSTSVSFQSSSLYYGNPSSLGNIPPQLVARIKLKRKLNKTLGWYRKAGKKHTNKTKNTQTKQKQTNKQKTGDQLRQCTGRFSAWPRWSAGFFLIFFFFNDFVCLFLIETHCVPSHS